MTQDVPHDSDETTELLRRAAGGDAEGVEELFTRHRSRIRRMVQLRLSPSLRSRVDSSDVVQETLIEAHERLDDFIAKRPMPFFLWLRWLARQRLMALHRHHVGTKARDPRREVSLHPAPLPEATTEGLASQLLGGMTTPSHQLLREEMKTRLEDAINTLDPHEREILALRHFEQLSNAEAAAELEISPAAASKRYVRALVRLQGLLESLRIGPSALDILGP